MADVENFLFDLNDPDVYQKMAKGKFSAIYNLAQHMRAGGADIASIEILKATAKSGTGAGALAHFDIFQPPGQRAGQFTPVFNRELAESDSSILFQKHIGKIWGEMNQLANTDLVIPNSPNYWRINFLSSSGRRMGEDIFKYVNINLQEHPGKTAKRLRRFAFDEVNAPFQVNKKFRNTVISDEGPFTVGVFFKDEQPFTYLTFNPSGVGKNKALHDGIFYMSDRLAEAITGGYNQGLPQELQSEVKPGARLNATVLTPIGGFKGHSLIRKPGEMWNAMAIGFDPEGMSGTQARLANPLQQAWAKAKQIAERKGINLPAYPDIISSTENLKNEFNVPGAVFGGFGVESHFKRGNVVDIQTMQNLYLKIMPFSYIQGQIATAGTRFFRSLRSMDAINQSELVEQAISEDSETSRAKFYFPSEFMRYYPAAALAEMPLDLLRGFTKSMAKEGFAAKVAGSQLAKPTRIDPVQIANRPRFAIGTNRVYMNSAAVAGMKLPERSVTIDPKLNMLTISDDIYPTVAGILGGGDQDDATIASVFRVENESGISFRMLVNRQPNAPGEFYDLTYYDQEHGLAANLDKERALAFQEKLEKMGFRIFKGEYLENLPPQSKGQAIRYNFPEKEYEVELNNGRVLRFHAGNSKDSEALLKIINFSGGSENFNEIIAGMAPFAEASAGITGSFVNMMTFFSGQIGTTPKIPMAFEDAIDATQKYSAVIPSDYEKMVRRYAALYYGIENKFTQGRRSMWTSLSAAHRMAGAFSKSGTAQGHIPGVKSGETFSPKYYSLETPVDYYQGSTAAFIESFDYAVRNILTRRNFSGKYLGEMNTKKASHLALRLSEMNNAITNWAEDLNEEQLEMLKPVREAVNTVIAFGAASSDKDTRGRIEGFLEKLYIGKYKDQGIAKFMNSLFKEDRNVDLSTFNDIYQRAAVKLGVQNINDLGIVGSSLTYALASISKSPDIAFAKLEQLSSYLEEGLSPMEAAYKVTESIKSEVRNEALGLLSLEPAQKALEVNDKATPLQREMMTKLFMISQFTFRGSNPGGIFFGNIKEMIFENLREKLGDNPEITEYARITALNANTDTLNLPENARVRFQKRNNETIAYYFDENFKQVEIGTLTEERARLLRNIKSLQANSVVVGKDFHFVPTQTGLRPEPRSLFNLEIGQGAEYYTWRDLANQDEAAKSLYAKINEASVAIEEGDSGDYALRALHYKYSGGGVVSKPEDVDIYSIVKNLNREEISWLLNIVNPDYYATVKAAATAVRLFPAEIVESARGAETYSQSLKKLLDERVNGAFLNELSGYQKERVTTAFRSMLMFSNVRGTKIMEKYYEALDTGGDVAQILTSIENEFMQAFDIENSLEDLRKLGVNLNENQVKLLKDKFRANIMGWSRIAARVIDPSLSDAAFSPKIPTFDKSETPVSEDIVKHLMESVGLGGQYFDPIAVNNIRNLLPDKYFSEQTNLDDALADERRVREMQRMQAEQQAEMAEQQAEQQMAEQSAGEPATEEQQSGRNYRMRRYGDRRWSPSRSKNLYLANKIQNEEYIDRYNTLWRTIEAHNEQNKMMMRWADRVVESKDPDQFAGDNRVVTVNHLQLGDDPRRRKVRAYTTHYYHLFFDDLARGEPVPEDQLPLPFDNPETVSPTELSSAEPQSPGYIRRKAMNRLEKRLGAQKARNYEISKRKQRVVVAQRTEEARRIMEKQESEIGKGLAYVNSTGNSEIVLPEGSAATTGYFVGWDKNGNLIQRGYLVVHRFVDKPRYIQRVRREMMRALGIEDTSSQEQPHASAGGSGGSSGSGGNSGSGGSRRGGQPPNEPPEPPLWDDFATPPWDDDDNPLNESPLPEDQSPTDYASAPRRNRVNRSEPPPPPDPIELSEPPSLSPQELEEIEPPRREQPPRRGRRSDGNQLGSGNTPPGLPPGEPPVTEYNPPEPEDYPRGYFRHKKIVLRQQTERKPEYDFGAYDAYLRSKYNISGAAEQIMRDMAASISEGRPYGFIAPTGFGKTSYLARPYLSRKDTAFAVFASPTSQIARQTAERVTAMSFEMLTSGIGGKEEAIATLKRKFRPVIHTPGSPGAFNELSYRALKNIERIASGEQELPEGLNYEQLRARHEELVATFEVMLGVNEKMEGTLQERAQKLVGLFEARKESLFKSRVHELAAVGVFAGLGHSEEVLSKAITEEDGQLRFNYDAYIRAIAEAVIQNPNLYEKNRDDTDPQGNQIKWTFQYKNDDDQEVSFDYYSGRVLYRNLENNVPSGAGAAVSGTMEKAGSALGRLFEDKETVNGVETITTNINGIIAEMLDTGGLLVVDESQTITEKSGPITRNMLAKTKGYVQTIMAAGTPSMIAMDYLHGYLGEGNYTYVNSKPVDDRIKFQYLQHTPGKGKSVDEYLDEVVNEALQAVRRRNGGTLVIAKKVEEAQKIYNRLKDLEEKEGIQVAAMAGKDAFAPEVIEQASAWLSPKYKMGSNQIVVATIGTVGVGTNQPHIANLIAMTAGNLEYIQQVSGRLRLDEASGEIRRQAYGRNDPYGKIFVDPEYLEKMLQSRIDTLQSFSSYADEISATLSRAVQTRAYKNLTSWIDQSQFLEQQIQYVLKKENRDIYSAQDILRFLIGDDESAPFYMKYSKDNTQSPKPYIGEVPEEFTEGPILEVGNLEDLVNAKTKNLDGGEITVGQALSHLSSYYQQELKNARNIRNLQKLFGTSSRAFDYAVRMASAHRSNVVAQRFGAIEAEAPDHYEQMELLFDDGSAVPIEGMSSPNRFVANSVDTQKKIAEKMLKGAFPIGTHHTQPVGNEKPSSTDKKLPGLTLVSSGSLKAEAPKEEVESEFFQRLSRRTESGESYGESMFNVARELYQEKTGAVGSPRDWARFAVAGFSSQLSEREIRNTIEVFVDSLRNASGELAEFRDAVRDVSLNISEATSAPYAEQAYDVFNPQGSSSTPRMNPGGFKAGMGSDDKGEFYPAYGVLRNVNPVARMAYAASWTYRMGRIFMGDTAQMAEQAGDAASVRATGAVLGQDVHSRSGSLQAARVASALLPASFGGALDRSYVLSGTKLGIGVGFGLFEGLSNAAQTFAMAGGASRSFAETLLKFGMYAFPVAIAAGALYGGVTQGINAGRVADDQTSIWEWLNITQTTRSTITTPAAQRVLNERAISAWDVAKFNNTFSLGQDQAAMYEDKVVYGKLMSPKVSNNPRYVGYAGDMPTSQDTYVDARDLTAASKYRLALQNRDMYTQEEYAATRGEYLRVYGSMMAEDVKILYDTNEFAKVQDYLIEGLVGFNPEKMAPLLLGGQTVSNQVGGIGARFTSTWRASAVEGISNEFLTAFNTMKNLPQWYNRPEEALNLLSYYGGTRQGMGQIQSIISSQMWVEKYNQSWGRWAVQNLYDAGVTNPMQFGNLDQAVSEAQKFGQEIPTQDLALAFSGGATTTAAAAVSALTRGGYTGKMPYYLQKKLAAMNLTPEQDQMLAAGVERLFNLPGYRGMTGLERLLNIGPDRVGEELLNNDWKVQAAGVFGQERLGQLYNAGLNNAMTWDAMMGIRKIQTAFGKQFNADKVLAAIAGPSSMAAASLYSTLFMGGYEPPTALTQQIAQINMTPQQQQLAGAALSGDVRAMSSLMNWSPQIASQIFSSNAPNLYDFAGRPMIMESFAKADMNRQFAVGMLQGNGMWGGLSNFTQGLLSTSFQSLVSQLPAPYRNASGLSEVLSIRNQRMANFSLQLAGIQGAMASENMRFLWGSGSWSNPAPGSYWYLEDIQRSLQHQFTMTGFDIQEERARINRQFQQRQESISGSRMQVNNQYQLDMLGLQWQGMQMGWQYQDTTRALSWQWTQEDYQEQARFMTGRQRKLAERQMERQTTMHNLEDEQIQKNRNLEKERYEKQEEYTRKMIALEREQFDLQVEQSRRYYELQMEDIKRSRDEYLQMKAVQDEMIKKSREHQAIMLQLQAAAAGVQAEMAKEQAELEKVLDPMRELNDLTTAVIAEAAKSDTAAFVMETVANAVYYIQNSDPGKIRRVTDAVREFLTLLNGSKPSGVNVHNGRVSDNYDGRGAFFK